MARMNPEAEKNMLERLWYRSRYCRRPPFPWELPKYTREQVDKAGEILRDMTDEEYARALNKRKGQTDGTGN